MQEQLIQQGKFLYHDIAQRICEDFWKEAKLPSERNLALHYRCTRTTIRTALDLLQEKKLLTRQPKHHKRSLVHPALVTEPEPSDCSSALLLLGRENLKDPNYMDFVAGCFDQAYRENIILTTWTLPRPDEPDAPAAPPVFPASGRPDGYIVAGKVNMEFLHALHNSSLPCVFLGNQISKLRLPEHHFFECYLPQEDKYEMVLRKFLDLGHRRILALNFDEYRNLVQRLYDEYQLPFEDFAFVNVPWSIQSALKPLQEKSAEIARIAGNYTAMLVPFGNVIGFDIYMALIKAGIRIPEDLSLVYDSGKPEWFVPHFKISTVFSSAWDEGANCVKELKRQLLNGEPLGGIHYTEYRFLDNGTIAPPPGKKK